MSLGIFLKLSTNRIDKKNTRMNKTMEDYDPIPNINRLLKAEGVAELLNISWSFAYLLIKSGQIQTFG